MNRKALVIFVSTLLFASIGSAKGGGFGFNFGIGLPFLSQAGLNYVMSDKLSFGLSYNQLKLDSGLASVSLTLPEASINWHPFSGSFFLGLGYGSQSFLAKATETTTGESVEIKVDSTAAIGKLGWMWGASDGGLWFGIDMSVISPSGAKTTITTIVPETDKAYIDAKEQSTKFGNSSYSNLTFFRLGYLF